MSMFQLSEENTQNAVIKVIGVGGGGSNAIQHMLEADINGVEFYCANTDAQALKRSACMNTLQLGAEITKGLGAGADPNMGRQSAEEDKDAIRDILQGSDMVFITAGMGGGTGTGAAPIIAEIAKEMGILTVAVVTKPFSFEGRIRLQVADEGIKELSQTVDSLITIPNNKLLSVLGKNITLLNAFKTANNVLLGAVQGIADLITRPGLINVDFADVRTVMSEMGMAMMGTGVGTGDNRAVEAAEAAISSPLLEDINLSGAKGILVNITAGPDMSIGEFEQVGETVKNFTSESATVVVGTVIDTEMRDEIRVTVVVTGLGHAKPTASTSKLTHAHTHTPVKTETRSMSSQPTTTLERPATLHASVPHTHVQERPQTAQPQQATQYRQPVQPTQQQQPHRPMTYTQEAGSQDTDYLDIPAFLRRKAKEEVAD